MASAKSKDPEPDMQAEWELEIQKLNSAVRTAEQIVNTTRASSIHKIAQLKDELAKCITDGAPSIHGRIRLVMKEIQEQRAEVEYLRAERNLFLDALGVYKASKRAIKDPETPNIPIAESSAGQNQPRQTSPNEQANETRYSSASYEYESTQSTEPPRKRSRHSEGTAGSVLAARDRPRAPPVVSDNQYSNAATQALPSGSMSKAASTLPDRTTPREDRESMTSGLPAANDQSDRVSTHLRASAYPERDILDRTPDSMGFSQARLSPPLPDLDDQIKSPAVPNRPRQSGAGNYDRIAHIPVLADPQRITRLGDISRLHKIPVIIYVWKPLYGRDPGWYSIGCKVCNTNVTRDDRFWFGSQSSLHNHFVGCGRAVFGDTRVSFDDLMKACGHMERLDVEDVEFLDLHPTYYPKVRLGKWHYLASESSRNISSLQFRASDWKRVSMISKAARSQ